MTKIIVATFSAGNGSVEIDSALFAVAEAALEKERQRQAVVAKAPTEKPAPTTRRIVGLIGARASGFFG